MSPLRSIGNIVSSFDDYRSRTGEGARNAFSATGGNQTNSNGGEPGNGYRYHVFTSPGTLTVNSGSREIEFLVVAGGGGGGYGNGGGGGAGGLRSNDPNIPDSNMRITSTVTIDPGSYAITVGDGGGSHNAPFEDNSRIGSNSSIGSLVVASGGGGGGPWGPNEDSTYYPTGDGGSGGGSEPHSGSALTSPDPLTPNKQGHTGGTQSGGGGGGGAGGNGSSAIGGQKLSCPAFSSPVIHPICPMPSRWQSYVGSNGDYAGGGYGYPGRTSGHNSPYPANPQPEPSFAGTVNTGGGADSNQGGPTVTGGKGIVIIRYQVT